MFQTCWPLLVLGFAATFLFPAAGQGACPITSGDLDGNGTPDLRLVGTPGVQNVRLVNDAGAASLFLDCNGNGVYTDAALGDVNGVPLPGVEVIDLQLKGRDAITYQIQGAVNGALQQVAVTFLGGPNRLTVTGATGSSMQDHSSLVFDVNGGSGADTVEILLGSIEPIRDSGLVLRGDLGAGDDVARFQGPDFDLIASSALDIDVDLALGTGRNRVSIDGRRMEVFGESFVRIDLEGGDSAMGSDSVLMEGPHLITSRVFVNARLRGGNDTFVSSLNSGAGNSVHAGGQLRYRVNGGVGADLITMPDEGETSSSNLNGVLEGLFDVSLEGGTGNDIVTFDSTFTSLGGGLLRVRADGGDQADTVVVETLHVEDSSTDEEASLSLHGGRGNDTLLLSASDPDNSVTPFGFHFMNGGPNAVDLCLGLGGFLPFPLNCELGLVPR